VRPKTAIMHRARLCAGSVLRGCGRSVYEGVSGFEVRGGLHIISMVYWSGIATSGDRHVLDLIASIRTQSLARR